MRADAGHLDLVLRVPLAVLAVLGSGWLVLCVAAARRELSGRPTADGDRPEGRRRRVRRAVRAGVALLGATGLLAQVDGADAAPAGVRAAHPDTTSARPVPQLRAAEVGGSDIATPSITLGDETDPRRKVPSLWPVGREDTPERDAPKPGDGVLVVHHGDSLWSLVRERLGPEVSQTVVQQVVDALYDLNESVIGPDPDLVLPGQVLRVPAGDDRSKSLLRPDQIAPPTADHLH